MEAKQNTLAAVEIAIEALRIKSCRYPRPCVHCAKHVGAGSPGLRPVSLRYASGRVDLMHAQCVPAYAAQHAGYRRLPIHGGAGTEGGAV